MPSDVSSWVAMSDQSPAGPAAPATPVPPPGLVLPWQGVAERADKLILGLIMFSGVYYLGTQFLVPNMVDSHPAVLAMLRGSSVAVVTLGALAATGHGSIVVAVVAGLPGTILFDWVFWWAGRRWGHNALAMILGRSKNPQKRMRRAEAIAHKYGAIAVVTGYIIPIPTTVIAVAVGLGGMSLPVYVLLDIIGALIWLGLLATLGWNMGQSAVDVVHAISHYSLYLTFALVFLIMGRQIMLNRRHPVG
jgi:membrane protein DedA with SNARE-associated domain